MAIRRSNPASTNDDRVQRFLDALADEERMRAKGILWLRHSILVFENTYGMTSAEMVAGVESGQIEETDDICSWLIKVDLLRDVVSSDGSTSHLARSQGLSARPCGPAPRTPPRCG